MPLSIPLQKEFGDARRIHSITLSLVERFTVYGAVSSKTANRSMSGILPAREPTG
jgi:hypothetical protein